MKIKIGMCGCVLTSLLAVMNMKGAEMKLSSPDFQNGQPLPDKCAYRGENLSPELIIENVPGGTKSLVLIVDDPDAPMGTWNHCLVWNMGPYTKKIKEGEKLKGAVSGRNDFGNVNYDGPAPPLGTHRYFFRLYALNDMLTLPQGSSRKELEEAMDGKQIAAATLYGTYTAK